MAWTTPMTAASGSIWTAAQWNTHVRDNLNETAPAKATAAGRWYAVNGVNSLDERIPTHNSVTTSQTTTSTSYVDLATTGPAVTVTTSTYALVMMYCWVDNSNAGAASAMSHAVSSATTIAATDNYAVRSSGSSTFSGFMAWLHTGLTAGSNVFTCKYRVSSGTGTFSNRRISVLPF